MINSILLLVLTFVSLACYATGHGFALPGEISNLQSENHAEGELRLVDGLTQTSGRVEIFRAGEWRTVCQDQFGVAEARAVCTQLGYGNTWPVVWRDAPARIGTRGRHRYGQHHGCANDNAGVECDTRSYVEHLRLVGGTARSGRLEVNYGGTWGPVCTDHFSNDDAQVACTALGFDGTGAQMTTIYGRGTGDVLLANVNCAGDEMALSACRYTGPFDADRYCSSGGHVGLNCLEATPVVLSNVTARLVGGSAVSGRLELSVAGVWGSVCGDGFDNAAAKVACRMLGLPTEHSVVYSFSLTHQTLPVANIWLDDVQCNGTEQSLVECRHRDWRTHNCNHQSDVGVFCSAFTHAALYHQIRLAGSGTAGMGRVEVNYYGVWGTVCADGWRDSNTVVICRSLNLPFENARRTPIGAFRPIDGPTWLDDVQCGGDELSIFDCPHAALGIENCAHTDDVAVICEWHCLVDASHSGDIIWYPCTTGHSPSYRRTKLESANCNDFYNSST